MKVAFSLNELSVLEQEKIKNRINELFLQNETEIKLQFNEIEKFIDKHATGENWYNNISYDKIVPLLKDRFCKSIVEKAKDNLLSTRKEINEDVILKLLTTENLKEAILGEPMIYAYEDLIRDIPYEDLYDPIFHGNIIILLEHEYLDWNYMRK